MLMLDYKTITIKVLSKDILGDKYFPITGKPLYSDILYRNNLYVVIKNFGLYFDQL